MTFLDPLKSTYNINTDSVDYQTVYTTSVAPIGVGVGEWYFSVDSQAEAWVYPPAAPGKHFVISVLNS